MPNITLNQYPNTTQDAESSFELKLPCPKGAYTISSNRGGGITKEEEEEEAYVIGRCFSFESGSTDVAFTYEMRWGSQGGNE
ncbi:hypothetical protein EAE99_004860 [Botrytis elliptica]|nr:hypothetical protein EAE99_004860 [Botrytis elliptica]